MAKKKVVEDVKPALVEYICHGLIEKEGGGFYTRGDSIWLDPESDRAKIYLERKFIHKKENER